MPFALPQLDILLAALLALAVCLLVVAFAKAFFGVAGSLLGKLPVIGGWIDATAHHIEQRITNVFGGFAGRLEATIGAAWHSTARIVDKTWALIARHSGLLATIAAGVPGVGVIVHLYGLVHEARRLATLLAHELVGIGHDVHTRVKGVERGIGADVLPRIRSLDRELERVEHVTIPGVIAEEHAIAGRLESLRSWVHRHLVAARTRAFAEAVALAIAALGLSWIRCPTAKGLFKRRGCNLWNGLDELLGIFADVLIIANICQVIPWLEEGFSTVAAPLIGLLTEAGAGLCSADAHPPELLPATTLHLPASPSAALYLP